MINGWTLEGVGQSTGAWMFTNGKNKITFPPHARLSEVEEELKARTYQSNVNKQLLRACLDASSYLQDLSSLCKGAVLQQLTEAIQAAIKEDAHATR